MKIALVQDWLTELGGAEKVFSALYELYPDADIYTLVYNPKVLKTLNIPENKVTASAIQRMPFSKSKYRYYLPLFTKAIESFDLSKYDVIISSSSCVSKGVLTHSNQLHICYCHSPVRYGWDLYFQYLNNSIFSKLPIISSYIKSVLQKLRTWDIISSNRVDYFVSNSNYIKKRIFKIYRREAVTIYPPVSIDDFELPGKKDDFYLTCSRFVPYKRIDLIVRAFSKMPDKKLIVIGTGPELPDIQKLKTSNIELSGYQPFSVLKDYMQRAKAFVFAAEEDFGIVPVEAQACGTPVIAYGKGGVLESVIAEKTGIFFDTQSSDAIIDAINEFEKKIETFNFVDIQRNAKRFNKERFKNEFQQFVEKMVEKKVMM